MGQGASAGVRAMSIFTKIKSALPADVVLTQFLGLPRFRRFCCPFHDDHHPSMTTKDGGIVCWACQWRGDVFCFLEDYLKVDRRESLRIAACLAGITLPDLPKRKRKAFRLPSVRASVLQVRRETSGILHELERAAGEAWRRAWDRRDQEEVWELVERGATLDRQIAWARQ